MIAFTTSAAVLVLAALGGLISEQAGVLNLSLEACIVGGAFSAALAAAVGAPPPMAAAAAIATGAVIGFVLATVHLVLGADIYIVGLGLNLLVPSLVNLISQLALGHRGIVTFQVGRKIAEYWFMILPALGLMYVLYRTETGRRLRAAGSRPDFLSERGISPDGVKALTLIASSSLAALAGFVLVYGIEAYVPGISAGRGWIALALVWVGFRRPLGVPVSVFFFVFSEKLAQHLQGVFTLSPSLLLPLPYLITLLVLILMSIIRRRRAEP